MKHTEHQGYKILECYSVGTTDFVLGHNPKAPDPYVVWQSWEDKNGKPDYVIGSYCPTHKRAQEKLFMRVIKEINYWQYIKLSTLPLDTLKAECSTKLAALKNRTKDQRER